MYRAGMDDPALSGVAETLLIPLYNRAMESQRPDAMIKDEKAVALVAQMSYDFDQVRKIRMNEGNKVARIMLTREMDRYARDFLSRQPEGAVVHIGCGLDSRFERVDNGRVEWYDLDLPDVIELRRKLIGGEGKRCHLLGCSVLEDAWLGVVKVHSGRPFLFLAENVFVYFTEEQVKALVLRLRDHFPGAELVFDGWTPFFVWLGNIQLSRSKFAGLLHWGFWRSQTIEGWGEGIHLLGQWGFFDQPEPRMAPYRWIAPLFHLFKPMRIFHFRLGEAAGEERPCAAQPPCKSMDHQIKNIK
jgi:O-methyltransferase involved in polyketide biosynthesis